jgi:hypothetical protein
MPALLARSAAEFGLQTAPVALLREAFARWPPWSSPSKRSALELAMALGFGPPAALAFRFRQKVVRYFFSEFARIAISAAGEQDSEWRFSL